MARLHTHTVAEITDYGDVAALLAGDNATITGTWTFNNEITVNGVNSSTWGSGSGALSGLSDVTVTSVASDEVLQYTGAGWENQTLVEAIGSKALDVTGLWSFSNDETLFGLTSARAGNASYKNIQLFEGGIMYNDNTSTTPRMYFLNNAYYDGSWKYISTDVAESYFMNAGQHIWRSATSGSAGAVITWSEKMRLSAGGDLGIGRTPSYKLDVEGDIRATSGNTIYIGAETITEAKISAWDTAEASILLANVAETITEKWSFDHANGIDVGAGSVTAASIANWQSAFGWGNHSSQNYAYTTGDTFTGTMVFGTSSKSIHNDNITLGLGTGEDWHIFSSGTHMYIDQQNATTNDLYIRNTSNANQFQFDISAGTLICTDVQITV